MTNQTQVSAELSEAVARITAHVESRLEGARQEAKHNRISLEEATEFATVASVSLNDLRAVLAERTAMAALISEMQADMSGKTVMSEEAFRELHGKAERLSAVEAERDALRKALERAKAYIGALPGTDDAIAAYEDIRQALTGAKDHG